jgi:hypothetical protein
MHYGEARYLVKQRFFQIGKIMTAVAAVRLDNGGGHTGGSASGHAQISDPTALAAVRCAERLQKIVIDSGKDAGEIVENPEEWINVFKIVLDNFDGSMTGKVIRRRFWKQEPWTASCNALSISKTKYYVCEAEAIECGIVHGAQKKLFSID